MRILDSDVPEMTGDGAVEVGLRLSRPVPTPAELRKIMLPATSPKEIQLELEEMKPATADAAETDLPEIVEPEPTEESARSTRSWMPKALLRRPERVVRSHQQMA